LKINFLGFAFLMQILSLSTTVVILSPWLWFIPARIGFGRENPTEFHNFTSVASKVTGIN
jgi:hypothetical protein